MVKDALIDFSMCRVTEPDQHVPEKPIGIFGGTFDPIHFGHLRLAEELAESLALKQVVFIPTGWPPHRDQPQTAAEHRLAMARLAIAGNPQFSINAREIHRETPAYTIDTLLALREEYGTQQPICLLMGADAFLGLPSWRRWQELFDLTHIAVAYRPGFPRERWQDSMSPLLRQTLETRLSDSQTLHHTPAGHIATLSITALDISATHIRDTLQAGRNPRYLLPDAVLDYIHAHQLYPANPT